MRTRAVGGVSGTLAVAAFVGGWIAAGLHRPGYSPVRQAISQLARSGTHDRAWMTAGFVGYGALVTVLGATAAGPRSRALGALLVANGLATLGVAAFPLSAAGGGAEDLRHATCATVGYATLALAPLAGRRIVGRIGIAFSLVTAVALALTPLGRDTGLWQRIGLTTGDAWLLLLSARLLSRAPLREV